MKYIWNMKDKGNLDRKIVCVCVCVCAREREREREKDHKDVQWAKACFRHKEQNIQKH